MIHFLLVPRGQVSKPVRNSASPESEGSSASPLATHHSPSEPRRGAEIPTRSGLATRHSSLPSTRPDNKLMLTKILARNCAFSRHSHIGNLAFFPARQRSRRILVFYFFRFSDFVFVPPRAGSFFSFRLSGFQLPPSGYRHARTERPRNPTVPFAAGGMATLRPNQKKKERPPAKVASARWRRNGRIVEIA